MDLGIVRFYDLIKIFRAKGPGHTLGGSLISRHKHVYAFCEHGLIKLSIGFGWGCEALSPLVDSPIGRN